MKLTWNIKLFFYNHFFTEIRNRDPLKTRKDIRSYAHLMLEQLENGICLALVKLSLQMTEGPPLVML